MKKKRRKGREGRGEYIHVGFQKTVFWESEVLFHMCYLDMENLNVKIDKKRERSTRR